MKAKFTAILSLNLLLAVSHLEAQVIDDISLRYSFMNITEAKVGGQTQTPHFYRHNVELEFGRKQFTFGVIYQKATKDSKTIAGVPENGVMLASGYDFVLSHTFRLQTNARLGITSGNNPAQPLYATDTDLRLNVVAFNTEGAGYLLHKAVFPSSYAGVVINKYGRVQAIAGAGVWWNYIGLYATGYNAFNGCADPFNPGENADNKFANLQNQGLTLEVTYDLANFKLGLKQNFGVKNSGNDLLISLQYRHFFGGLEL